MHIGARGKKSSRNMRDYSLKYLLVIQQIHYRVHKIIFIHGNICYLYLHLKIRIFAIIIYGNLVTHFHTYFQQIIQI